MVDVVTAWQCIGCGRIEAPQQCVGVCQDRKVELVYVAEHRAATARAREVDDLLRVLAHTTPRDGDWERTYRALQARALKVLKDEAA